MITNRIKAGLVATFATLIVAIPYNSVNDDYTVANNKERLAAFVDKTNPIFKPTAKVPRKEIECLARNIYFEARGEPIAGQIAVGLVTLNRVKDPKYPNNVCGVVRQQRNGVCQFSWVCRQHKPARRLKLFAEKMVIAEQLYKFYYLNPLLPDLVDGATHFHATYVDPYWAKHLVHTVTIGQHVFYRSI